MPEKRTDEDYEIEALTKGLVVLEALEGERFEPVKIDRLVQRSGLKKDLVMRCLKTFKIRGYAIQNERKEWAIGPDLSD
jgi:DNA-binding IclR family transcriptional regulator